MKKTHITVISVLIAILLGYLYLQADNNGKDGEVIRVGQISALSGFGSDVGQEERNGALLAVEYVNKNGGVGGRKIEMISEDVSIDKLKVTSSAIQKLVNVDKVLAIVGPQWDDSASIAVPLSQDLKIPIISPNSSPQVEEKISSPYFFGTFYSDEVGIKTILKFAKDKGYKRIAIVEPANFGFWKYTSDLMKKHAEDYGVKIVGEEYGNDLGNTDYKTLIAKAKQSNPDAVFGSYADLECLFIQQAKNQGLNAPLLSNESAGTPKALANCAPTLEGFLYFSTPGQDSKYTEFEKAYTARFGSKPLSPSAVTSYDAMLVTAEAMNKVVATGKELSRDGIMDEITKMKFTKGSSMPEIVFDEKGFVITKGDAFIVKGIRGGEMVDVKI